MTYMITWTETATGNFYTENVNGCELLDRLMDTTINISEAYLAPDFTHNIADDLRIELQGASPMAQKSLRNLKKMLDKPVKVW